MRDQIIPKLKEAGLTGRGGACYPTWQKWEAVHNAPGEKKYVVCNASEGEPDVLKDKYLIKKHPERVIDGIKIAMHYLRAEKAFFYLNSSYYDQFAVKLRKVAGPTKIEIFKKPHSAGYIGGEETSALNTVEGKRTEPRLRPPYPVTHGIWGAPTLVGNVETFYDVSLIFANAYKKKRFFSISGDCLWTGVYELPENYSIEKILHATNNFPDYPFFVQIGGGASGYVLNSGQLKQPATGAGSITIYSMEKHEPMAVIRHWINFFERESCGQCTPCREGTYRLKEMMDKNAIDWDVFMALLVNLQDTAFCGLGCAVPIPIVSFIKNVLPKYKHPRVNIPESAHVMLCDCFK